MSQALAMQPLEAPRRPRAIVFDFDGTLVDTMQSFADTAADVMAERYAVTWKLARARYLETSGIPFFQQLEVIFPEDARNEAAAAEFERRKLAAFFDERFDDDVRDTLNRLRDEGFLVAVSSNNFQELIEQFVDRDTVAFDAVLGCKDNFFKGPQHFGWLCDRFDLDPDDILFVGDSLMDAVRAHESGVRFVGRVGTFTADAFVASHPGTPTVERLGELPAIIDALG